MALTRRPLDGYPDSWGAHRASVFGHAGPTSYVQVTYGPVAGGDVAVASEAGLKYFEYLDSGVTDTGNFLVQSIPTQPSTGAPLGQGAAVNYRLRWIAQRTATIGGQAQTAGSEAVATTNLSAEVVRLLAVGQK